jgi:nicotinate-nucleotide pyrophosphorylase (carboxylating)
MSVGDVKRAVERCLKAECRIPLEVSGGITLENVRAYAETGVNFISVGTITHSAKAADMSIRLAPV